ncbi:MAG TPA: hypothetical protein PKD76_01010 [Solirubrobacterales bacterium]|nr:hypothetical protein [Solirubrobacterales bacterium]
MSHFLVLVPALLLLLTLSLGFFPGEKVIIRVRSRRARHRPTVKPLAQAVPELLDLVRQTGREIAYALAVRPPPRSSLIHI